MPHCQHCCAVNHAGNVAVRNAAGGVAVFGGLSIVVLRVRHLPKKG